MAYACLCKTSSMISQKLSRSYSHSEDPWQLLIHPHVWPHERCTARFAGAPPMSLGPSTSSWLSSALVRRTHASEPPPLRASSCLSAMAACLQRRHGSVLCRQAKRTTYFCCLSTVVLISHALLLRGSWLQQNAAVQLHGHSHLKDPWPFLRHMAICSVQFQSPVQPALSLLVTWGMLRAHI